MLRVAYKFSLFALILSSCSVFPQSDIEFLETVEISSRTIPEEFTQIPEIPSRFTTAQTIEDGLQLGSDLRLYACALYNRYRLVIEYFSEGEIKIEEPGTDKCLK